jgi:hypothetical protein
VHELCGRGEEVTQDQTIDELTDNSEKMWTQKSILLGFKLRSSIEIATTLTGFFLLCVNSTNRKSHTRKSTAQKGLHLSTLTLISEDIANWTSPYMAHRYQWIKNAVKNILVK